MDHCHRSRHLFDMRVSVHFILWFMLESNIQENRQLFNLHLYVQSDRSGVSHIQ